MYALAKRVHFAAIWSRVWIDVYTLVILSLSIT